MDFEKKELIEAVNTSFSFSDICKVLKVPNNGTYIRQLKTVIQKWEIDTSHFCNTGAKKNTKYATVEKVCPVCDKPFVTQQGHKREAVTCSKSCSNVYFKSVRAKTENLKHYRTICFRFYPKACFLCGWDRIVDVHHIDGNHKNNDPKNLVPLCPNHHREIGTLLYGEETENTLREKLKTDGPFRDVG